LTSLPPRAHTSAVKSLADRVAVVTGGGSGIGRALCVAFARAGARVVVADLDEAGMTDTADAVTKAGGRALTVRTDVSRLADVRALADRAWSEFGAVHVLCNNAGIALWGGLDTATHQDWEWAIGVNLWGVIHGVEAFVPRMIAQKTDGHIVNTASMAGLTTAPFMSVYDVTKHGVVALSESMYKELQVTGAPIGVSVVCPGLIDTNIMRSSRNRPEELAEAGKAGPMAQSFGQALSDRLAGGYPPSEVAEQVVEGIRAGRFYIVPAQPEVKSAIGVRAEDLLALRNPTPRR
jgi:NAD(P)-dependent dehydrogenase (short-subunit alcohol dehydrogenase family)